MADFVNLLRQLAFVEIIFVLTYCVFAVSCVVCSCRFVNHRMDRTNWVLLNTMLIAITGIMVMLAFGFVE